MCEVRNEFSWLCIEYQYECVTELKCCVYDYKLWDPQH